jgi:FkbM family methyltransferase
VIEVGAHNGIVTRQFRTCAQNVVVHAYEANPYKRAIIDRNIKGLDSVNVNYVAVSEKNGQIQLQRPLHKPEAGEGHNTMDDSIFKQPWSKSSNQDNNAFTVPMIRLDQQPELQGKKITLMWICAQGAEPSIIRGAEGLILNNEVKFISFMFSLSHILLSDFDKTDPTSIFGWLHHRGYACSDCGIMLPGDPSPNQSPIPSPTSPKDSSKEEFAKTHESGTVPPSIPVDKLHTTGSFLSNILRTPERDNYSSRNGQNGNEIDEKFRYYEITYILCWKRELAATFRL